MLVPYSVAYIISSEEITVSSAICPDMVRVTPVTGTSVGCVKSMTNNKDIQNMKCNVEIQKSWLGVQENKIESTCRKCLEFRKLKSLDIQFLLYT